jgi:hypothetical protein
MFILKNKTSENCAKYFSWWYKQSEDLDKFFFIENI